MSLTETSTETSAPWEGKETTATYEVEGKRGVEITVNGQSAEMKALLDAARDKEGAIDYGKLDSKQLARNSRAFDMLLGETPQEVEARLGAIAGSNAEIVQAAIATLGEDEARNRAIQYGRLTEPDGQPSNPLAHKLMEHFNEIDTPQPQQEVVPAPAAEKEPPVAEASAEVGEREATELDVAGAAAEIGKVLTNLNGYVITKNADGSITIAEK